MVDGGNKHWIERNRRFLLHMVGVTFNIFHNAQSDNWTESWGSPGVPGRGQGEWQTLWGLALFTNWQESGSVSGAQPAWGSNPGSAISQLGDLGQASTPLCACFPFC